MSLFVTIYVVVNNILNADTSISSGHIQTSAQTDIHLLHLLVYLLQYCNVMR